jgi:hypothetical protein
MEPGRPSADFGRPIEGTTVGITPADDPNLPARLFADAAEKRFQFASLLGRKRHTGRGRLDRWDGNDAVVLDFAIGPWLLVADFQEGDRSAWQNDARPGGVLARVGSP